MVFLHTIFFLQSVPKPEKIKALIHNSLFVFNMFRWRQEKQSTAKNKHPHHPALPLPPSLSLPSPSPPAASSSSSSSFLSCHRVVRIFFNVTGHLCNRESWHTAAPHNIFQQTSTCCLLGQTLTVWNRCTVPMQRCTRLCARVHRELYEYCPGYCVIPLLLERA